MNQAALYSSEALARFDAEAQDSLYLLEDDAEHKRIALRSGRNISSQPYGQMKDTQGNMSDALVLVKADAGRHDCEDDLNNDQGRDLSIQPAHPRMALPYPASSINGPGIDGAGQIATLQAKLNQRLGPEYISTRQGPGGGKLSYIEGWKAIDLANEVFGFNGWSSSITRMDVDFLDESEGKKWNVGVSVVMRISLRDGTFHEDVGYGHCENVKMKHMALEKARKEASTDGLKRALRTFGRMLGNCLYDKKFIDTASKMKAAVPAYDLTELKRTSAAPQHAPPAAAPATRPVQVSPPQQRAPAVVQRQSPQAVQKQQQQPSTRQHTTPNDIGKTADTAPAQVDQQVSPPILAPQSREERLREERKAIAAAKQAALRSRKEKEEAARQEASGSKSVQEGTTLPLLIIRNEVQSKAASSSGQGRRISIDDADLENVDDYDMALMEAGLSDGADLLEEVSFKEARPIAKYQSSSSMDDSGIGMVGDPTPKHHRPTTRTNSSSKPPANFGKGRFVDTSSSPPYPSIRNDSSKHPSSSPRVQIPIKGRRMSLVNAVPLKVNCGNQIRLSQEQHSPPNLSQRSRGKGPSMQAPPNKRSGPGAYNEVQVKRPRNSPY